MIQLWGAYGSEGTRFTPQKRDLITSFQGSQVSSKHIYVFCTAEDRTSDIDLITTSSVFGVERLSPHAGQGGVRSDFDNGFRRDDTMGEFPALFSKAPPLHNIHEPSRWQMVKQRDEVKPP